MYRVKIAGLIGAFYIVFVGCAVRLLAGLVVVGGMRCGCCPGRDGSEVVRAFCGF